MRTPSLLSGDKRFLKAAHRSEEFLEHYLRDHEMGGVYGSVEVTLSPEPGDME